MKLEHILDSIHSSVASRWYFRLFTVFTRCILAVGFIPPSIKKILHQPFTILPDSNPVGHYFNALYNTGFYYEFIGWAQLIAAILLLFPRTAHIGALLFLPIIANIAVLTSSVGFVGTWIITIFMSLAATWLVAWEYDRLKLIIFSNRADRAKPVKWHFFLVPLFFALGGVVMGLLWWMIRLGNFSNYLTITLGLVGLGFIFGVVVAVHYRFMPVGRLQNASEPV